MDDDELRLMMIDDLWSWTQRRTTVIVKLLLKLKQAERLKSCKRRPEVYRLDGQLARWLIGLMVDRLDGR